MMSKNKVLSYSLILFFSFFFAASRMSSLNSKNLIDFFILILFLFFFVSFRKDESFLVVAFAILCMGLSVEYVFFVIVSVYLIVEKIRFNALKLQKKLIISTIILIYFFIIGLLNGGNLFHNIIRSFSISSFIFIYLFSNTFKKISRKEIFFCYIFFSLTSIFFAYTTENIYRLSVFQVSENIGFFIICLLFILTYRELHSVFLKIFSLFLLVFFIFLTESRSAYLILIFIPVWLFYRKYGILNLFLSFLSISLLFYIFLDFLIDFNLLPDRVSSFFLSLIYLFHDLSWNNILSFDLRGAVYMEGLGVWQKNPFFGSGAVSSKILQSLDGEVGMVDYHNLLIDILAQYGFIGVLLFFIYFLCLYFYSIDKLHGYDKRDINFLFLFYLFYSMIHPLIFNIKANIVFSLVIVSIVFFGRKRLKKEGNISP